MGLPEFNKRGTLDKGIHKCTSNEFYERFCYGSDSVRSDYREVLEQLFALAVSRDAKSIIVGGSFVTNKPEPNDLDCMLIVPNEKCCTLQTNELLIMRDCELDILIVDENRKDTVYSFLNMFSKDRYDIDVGMVEIILDEVKDKSTWDDFDSYYSVESLLEAREAYIYRHVIRSVAKKKLLVTIGNAAEFMLWNYDLAPIVSSGGWIFAPYIYECDNNVEVQFKRLQNWLNAIYYVYDTEICIFADGVGAHLIGKYLNDESNSRARLDKIILTRALLSRNYDWDKIKGKVNFVINIQNKSKEVFISEPIPKMVKMDALFGDAYKCGFDSSKVLNYCLKHEKRISTTEFSNTILPMYHMSSVIQDNIETVCWENMNEILNREMNLRDINIQAMKNIHF